MARIDSETFGFTVADVARMMRALMTQRLASVGCGITTGEARTLLHVAAGEGERQTHIADRLGVEPMTACGYIDRLEKQGLVQRIPDPTDRRAKLVMTTDAAASLIGTLLGTTTAAREDALQGLTPEEREIMMKALRHVRGNLQTLLAPQAAEGGTE